MGGTGLAAVAVSPPDGPVVVAEETESPSPSPTPTETETESPEPTPTETETATPSPSPTETEDPDSPPASTPVGPDATGPAAFGLCNAFTHGGLNSTSTAHEALANAAGGADSIGDYCATVPAPQDKADDEAAGTAADESGDEVEQQNQGPAPASNGKAGGQSNNSHKHSGGGQR